MKYLNVYVEDYVHVERIRYKIIIPKIDKGNGVVILDKEVDNNTI